MPFNCSGGKSDKPHPSTHSSARSSLPVHGRGRTAATTREARMHTGANASSLQARQPMGCPSRLPSLFCQASVTGRELCSEPEVQKKEKQNTRARAHKHPEILHPNIPKPRISKTHRQLITPPMPPRRHLAPLFPVPTTPSGNADAGHLCPLALGPGPSIPKRDARAWRGLGSWGGDTPCNNQETKLLF